MDIISIEILPRLPAKSLNRFKCVSKSFKTTISSQEFLQLYLRNQARSSDTNNLLVFSDNRVICYDLNSHSPSTASSTFSCANNIIIVVSTCNGLLCINVFDFVKDYVCIHNPSTEVSQYIHVPVIGQDHYNLGFAFDHENLDYKIVVVTDQNDISCYGNKTLVSSTNTSSWTVMENPFPLDLMRQISRSRRDGALINGHLLHWIFWSSCPGKGRIASFDVCKMKWVDDVLLPRYYCGRRHRKQLIDMGVFDDLLFSSFKNGDDHCFDVWVMKEYGVQDSWFKLSIPNSNDLHGVVPVTCHDESGEILIQHQYSSRLLWYNGKSGGTREAKFDGATGFSSNLQVHLCSKSLADPPRCKTYLEE